ncbi:unnamed protein product [Clonostachys rosea f. rosea IK726]|uniref:Uncharacterized protein n=1 Tax=Clonostachys rosea f. rosea IK726 TaxID=1349383 RepID=A0ACA9UJ89_BIOOC|nr:unnamed protein product [Clonostachys rosea f. rosea IK726]
MTREVECQVYDEEERLYCLLEHHIDMLLGRCGPVKVCNGPDVADSDIDRSNNDYKTPFQVACSASVGHDQGDSVGDNLREELCLDRP